VPAVMVFEVADVVDVVGAGSREDQQVSKVVPDVWLMLYKFLLLPAETENPIFSLTIIRSAWFFNVNAVAIFSHD
jgi:hypothetical protein